MMFHRAPAMGSVLSLSLLIAVLAPERAEATVMVPMSIDDLTQASAAVVRAKVLRQEGAWDREHRRIFTETELEVLESVHAAAPVPKTILVRTIGGEVGELGMKVSGSPRFERDEEVVIFLRVDPGEPAAYRVVGMAQGKFRVTRDAAGRTLCVPSLEGLAFARPDKNGQTVVREAEPVGAIALSELKARVKSAVAKRAPSRPGLMMPDPRQPGSTPE